MNASSYAHSIPNRPCMIDNQFYIASILLLSDMTLKITSEMVDDLNIDFETSNKWMEEAMMHKADSILPPKISMGPSEGSFINVMPCVLGGRDLQVAGLKVVTRYPGRTPSLDSKMVLMDATNGDYLAIIDADWITSRRTGAVAAHTISLFAKKDYATMGIIGLGECAKSTLHSLRSRDNRHLVVKLFKYKS